MNRFSARVLLLIFPSLWGCPLWAQSPAPHVQAAKARSKSSAAKVAPIVRQQLFGSIPISYPLGRSPQFVRNLARQILKTTSSTAPSSTPAKPSIAIRSSLSVTPLSH